MKRILLIALMFCSTARAATYYVDSQNGNDANSGLSASSAWRTIAKVNSVVFASGDIVLFDQGEVFYGGLRPSSAGVTYGSYGVGAKPVITGFTTLSSWTSLGGGVYETPCSACGMALNTVSIQDTLVPMGRYPNAGTANGGYLVYQSFSANGSTDAITGSQLAGGPSWVGGDVVVKRTNWSIDREQITAQSGSTLTFTSANPYPLNAGFGFFITNHPGTLDQLGEWYYDSTAKELLMYFGSVTPFAVGAATIDTLVVVNQNNIQISNISFDGANVIGIYAKNISNGNISSSTIKNIGQDGIMLDGPVNSYTINGDSILHTQNEGIHCLYNATYATVISNNYLGNIGAVPGMGIDYIGLSGNGQSLLIQGNTLKNIGYDGITIGSSNEIVSDNVIDTYESLADDGGGIYTGGNTSGPILIENNILLNGVGAPKGIADTTQNVSASGIFLDDNSHNVLVQGNTVYNTTESGIRVHNSSNNKVINNTTYYCGRGIDLSYDNPAYPAMNSDTVEHNILVGVQPAQFSLYAFSRSNTLSTIGLIDYNYYVNPFFPGGVVYNQYNGGTTSVFDVGNWPARYGYDVHTSTGPIQFVPYHITSDIGSNITNSTSLSGVASSSFMYLDFAPVTAGASYLLTFRLYSSGTETEDAGMQFLENGGNYHVIGQAEYFPVTTTPTRQSIFYQPAASETDMLGVDLYRMNNTLHLDSIDVQAVNGAAANPGDSVQFVYNGSGAVKAVTLSGTYKDALNNSYTSSIALQPYSSAVLMKVNAGVVTTYPPPTANAGGDATITLPNNSIRLYGTGTAAPGLAIVSYAWTQISGPAGDIVTPGAASTVVDNLAVGAHVYQLTVTDNNNNTGTATVTIYVNAGEGGAPPVANAGPNATLTLPANSVRLYGSGTASPGLTIVSYAWTQVSGPSGDIVTPDLASTVVDNLALGAHTFQLTVTDNSGATGTSEVTIYIVNGTSTLNTNTDSLAQQSVDTTVKALVSVYPNPAVSQLNVIWHSDYRGIATITVYDLTGRRLLAYVVQKEWADDQYAIGIVNLARGTYYLDIRLPGGKQGGHAIFLK